jgi:prepilin-type N-terminal cleavage/methylation domain-containing protein
MKKCRTNGFTLIELMIVLSISFVLLLIFIPNLMRFKAYEKQAEVKGNLKTLHTAQQAYYQEKNEYAQRVESLHFSPARGNRYTYRLATEGPLNSRVSEVEEKSSESVGIGTDTFAHKDAKAEEAWAGADAVVLEPNANGVAGMTAAGVSGTCPACEFMATAAGNIDDDALIDSWYISSQSGQTKAGDCLLQMKEVPAGEPGQVCNDVDFDAPGKVSRYR